MNFNLLKILILEAAFLLVLVASESIYRIFRIHPEITRKFTHTGLCLVALTAPLVTDSMVVISVMIILGLLLLYLGKKYQFFGSINNVERKTAGGPAILAAFFICYMTAVRLEDLALFYIPVLILAFGDPAAGLIGIFLNVRRWPASTWAGRANKSYAGSLVFFCISFLLLIILLPVFYQRPSMPLLLTGLAMGLAGTLLEAFSGRGYDNLTVPVGIMLFLILLKYFDYLVITG